MDQARHRARAHAQDAQGRDDTAPRAARQQGRFDDWRGEFNEERPHGALDYRGARLPNFGKDLRALATPDAGGVARAGVPRPLEVWWVSKCGTYKWKRRQLFISQTLDHEWIGFEEVDDGVWPVWFYDRLLVRLDERDFKLRG